MAAASRIRVSDWTYNRAHKLAPRWACRERKEERAREGRIKSQFVRETISPRGVAVRIARRERTNDTAAGTATCTPVLQRVIRTTGQQAGFFRLALFVNQLKRTRRNLERIKIRAARGGDGGDARHSVRFSPSFDFVVVSSRLRLLRSAFSFPAFPRAPSRNCCRSQELGRSMRNVSRERSSPRLSMRSAMQRALIGVPFGCFVNAFCAWFSAWCAHCVISDRASRFVLVLPCSSI